MGPQVRNETQSRGMSSVCAASLLKEVRNTRQVTGSDISWHQQNWLTEGQGRSWKGSMMTPHQAATGSDSDRRCGPPAPTGSLQPRHRSRRYSRWHCLGAATAAAATPCDTLAAPQSTQQRSCAPREARAWSAARDTGGTLPLEAARLLAATAAQTGADG